MFEISVIIPTYNRRKILEKTINSLIKQSLDKDKFQVIVVDDGSTDKTPDYLSAIVKSNQLNLLTITQDNTGQGEARNKGIDIAEGKILLFLGDDMIVKKNFLEEHLKIHKKYPEKNFAVLGFITWHEDIEVTKFMRWLTDGSSVLGKFGGHQFAFEKLKDKQETDYNFFYTSNISLKKDLLKKYRFDKDFKSYGWEDIELGYRLHKLEKLKLIYNEKAVAYHHHKITEHSLKDRMRSIGKSAKILDKKHPELKKLPGTFKKMIFKFLSNPISLKIFKSLKDKSDTFFSLYYYSLSKKYFLQGLKE